MNSDSGASQIVLNAEMIMFFGFPYREKVMLSHIKDQKSKGFPLIYNVQSVKVI